MIATVIDPTKLAEIEAGSRMVYYLAATEFWTRRLRHKHHGAIKFLCGHSCKAFQVVSIECIDTPYVEHVNCDSGGAIYTDKCYAINMGGGFHWPRQISMFEGDRGNQ